MPINSAKKALFLFLLLAFVSPLFAGSKSDAVVLLGHIELGETEPMFWHLTKMYQARGVEFPQDGVWKLKLKINDYTEVINRYSNGSVRIEVSRMVTLREARDYWDNWSKVLAAGNFDQDKFFRDDSERHVLANYNVLILSAHEIGHYVDFLYKMSDRDYGGGFLKDNDPMNCSEGYADRIAIATINELSSDKGFAELRSRYIELIRAFNAAIPAANRYSFDSIDYAGKRCGEIDLMKNGVNEDGRTVNENFFRQYASAYFNRHMMLLSDTGFGGLDAMLERDLFAPFFMRLDPVPRRFKLATLKEIEPIRYKEIFLGGDGLREEIYFQRSLSEDFGLDEKHSPKQKVRKHSFVDSSADVGHLQIEWAYDRPTVELEDLIFRERKFTLKLKANSAADNSEISVSVPPLPAGGYNFSSFTMLTADTFILVLTPFDMERRYDHLLLAIGKRKGKQWSAKTAKLRVEDVSDADEIGGNWYATESGRVKFVRVQRKKNLPTLTLSVYELNKDKRSARLVKTPFVVDAAENRSNNSMKNGLWRRFSWYDSIFGNDAGELFIVGEESDLQLGSDSGLYFLGDKPRLILGQISGFRDGNDLRSALVSGIASPRALAGGRIAFIDSTRTKAYLRQVDFLSVQ